VFPDYRKRDGWNNWKLLKELSFILGLFNKIYLLKHSPGISRAKPLINRGIHRLLMGCQI